MSAYTKLRGAAIDLYLGDGLAALRRGLRGAGRRLARRPRALHFFHQVDDPQSHLMLQGIARLLQVYPELTLVPHVVPEPAADVDPEPELRAAQQRRDAALLARHLQVGFPGVGPTGPHGELVPLPADRVRRVGAVLLAEREPGVWLRAAYELGEALWRDDGEDLARLVKHYGAVPGQQVNSRLETNYRRLRAMGHYVGGTCVCEGEYFEGVERLSYLHWLLSPRESAPLIGARPPATGSGDRSSRSEALEVFFSFRSPYSYLALELLGRPPFAGVPIVARPVLPMVTRGLPLPRAKRDYLVRDARREAVRQQIPFGRICDPRGEGVENALAGFVAAAAVGRGFEFARAATRGVWSEASELAVPRVVAGLVEASGGSVASFERARTEGSGRAAAEEHAARLRELGFWGVPVVGRGERWVWGQDRLWMLARDLEL